MKASQSPFVRASARRQFLRGTGGVVLGLPFLPSLVKNPAFAATSPKRFVAFTSEHGAANGSSFCPPASASPERKEIFPGYEIRYGTLSGQVSGDRRVLSPVLAAKSSVLTPRLLAKMNVLRGFDIDFYISHHWGGHLGNFSARVDANSLKAVPTIDQVMAYSPKFYPSVSGIRQRAMVTGQNFRGVSWGYSNPTAGTGPVQAVRTETSSRALFDSVMMGVSPPSSTPEAKRKPIVDRVLANYKALRDSNRRLSVDDRRRLDDHIARLAELERRFNLTTSVTCTTTKPTADSRSFDNDRRTNPQFFSLVNDVIAMAFACDTSRIATVCIISTFMLDYGGNWHQDVAHKAMEAGPQSMLVDSHQRTFEATILDLAAKLDQIEDGPGTTVLDNTLVQWTQEAGPNTHEAQAMPIVTFGSAGGYFKTGNFVDYRYQVPTARVTGGDYLGLPYRRWLGNALMAMGLSRSDFETGGVPGYGDPFSDSGFASKVNRDSRGSSIAQPLPIITG